MKLVLLFEFADEEVEVVKLCIFSKITPLEKDGSRTQTQAAQYQNPYS